MAVVVVDSTVVAAGIANPREVQRPAASLPAFHFLPSNVAARETDRHIRNTLQCIGVSERSGSRAHLTQTFWIAQQ